MTYASDTLEGAARVCARCHENTEGNSSVVMCAIVTPVRTISRCSASLHSQLYIKILESHAALSLSLSVASNYSGNF